MYKPLFLALIYLLFSNTLKGQENLPIAGLRTPDLERLAEEVFKNTPKDIELYQKRLKESEVDLRKMKAGKLLNDKTKSTVDVVGSGNNRKYTFSNKKAKDEAVLNAQKEIKELEAKIQGMKRGTEFHIPSAYLHDSVGYDNFRGSSYPIPSKAKVGDIGRLGEASVAQVLDASKMIIKVYGKRFVLNGVSTEGIVDGSPLPFDPIVYVAGTESAESQTIFSLVVIDETELMELLRQEFKKK